MLKKHGGAMKSCSVNQNNMLGPRDFITIGIFNAVGLFLYIAIGLLTISVPVLHLFAVQPLVAIVNGSVFLLLATKVNKKGVFFISGIIQGIVFSLLLGLYATLIIGPLVGFVSDLIWGTSKSKIRLILAYAFFMLGMYFGMVFLFLVFNEWFLSLFKGVALEHKQVAASNTTWLIVMIMILATFIASFLGGLMGSKMLKKHFVKAGMV